ncbi:PilZ domain-containing protein [Chelatococcus caeni]|uniref:PilZ domain-containing protein n=1 Tax=Chelatococcus caeni TaxID=1348468 RepID=UPI001618BBB1|nr:PilZ domain-containing protein [Chelatococcus caeni]
MARPISPTNIALRASKPDRRRHQRVPVTLVGRYMLPDKQEYPCQTLDMSPGGVSLVAPTPGAIGDRVIIYLEQIGRLEGEITRHIDNGFAVRFTATPRKREKIATQLMWLVHRDTLGLPEDRRHDRIVPNRQLTTMEIAGGERQTVRIIDISLSGAAVSSASAPASGTMVTLGRTEGRVTRHFEGGFAVEFLAPLPEQDFDETIAL